MFSFASAAVTLKQSKQAKKWPSPANAKIPGIEDRPHRRIEIAGVHPPPTAVGSCIAACVVAMQ
jgi:hypothetical protein